MKTTQIYLTAVLLLTSLLLHAQLKVTSVGNVGNIGVQIGTTTPLSTLSIGDAGATDTKVSIYQANNSTALKVQRLGTYESNLPGTGLLIYRINNSVAYGNSQGPPDEVYLYRPNGTLTNNGNYTIANFNSANSRSIFNSLSNPNSFLSDGSIENFVIKNITVSGNSISFDIRLCSNTDITLSNTNMLPEVSNAVNTVQTAGTVIVKSTDKITFEAGQEIILNNGFEVQQGGQLDVNIVTCGQ